MKYLVLGSGGQVGGRLSSYLKEHGHEVVDYDYKMRPDEDLRDHHMKLCALIMRCDYVFFLAFNAGGSTYLRRYQDSYNFLSNNVRIIENTFEALAAADTPFLYVSSQMSNMVHSPYGTIKRLGEFYTESLGGIFVRLWNVYGVEKDPNKFHAVSDFCLMAKRDKHIILKTTGQEQRQFLYVDDCCDALLHLSALHAEGHIPNGTPLHVTSFEWISMIEVAHKIASILQHDGLKITKGEKEDEVQHNMRNEPDRSVLRWWRPTTELRTGLENVIKSI